MTVKKFLDHAARQKTRENLYTETRFGNVSGCADNICRCFGYDATQPNNGMIRCLRAVIISMSIFGMLPFIGIVI